MTIELNNINLGQVSEIESTQIDQIGKVHSDQNQTLEVAEDSIKLSPEAQQLQQLEQRILDLPEVDMDKVNHIKAAISEGNYQINPAAIADKLSTLEESLAAIVD